MLEQVIMALSRGRATLQVVLAPRLKAQFSATQPQIRFNEKKDGLRTLHSESQSTSRNARGSRAQLAWQSVYNKAQLLVGFASCFVCTLYRGTSPACMCRCLQHSAPCRLQRRLVDQVLLCLMQFLHFAMMRAIVTANLFRT